MRKVDGANHSKPNEILSIQQFAIKDVYLEELSAAEQDIQLEQTVMSLSVPNQSQRFLSTFCPFHYFRSDSPARFTFFYCSHLFFLRDGLTLDFHAKAANSLEK